MKPYNIRILNASDVEIFQATRIAAVTQHPVAFLVDAHEEKARPLEEVASRLAPQDHRWVLAAVAANTVVGMVGFVRQERPKIQHKAFIWGMYVSPEYRSQGLGRKLMNETISRAKKLPGLKRVDLSVMTENKEAKELYESLGFETWGVEPSSIVVDNQPRDESHMTYWL